MARSPRGPKSYGRTLSGIDITDEYIAQAVAQAEAGWDVSEIRALMVRRPRSRRQSADLRVRIDAELRAALDERAAHDETTVSAVVRDALREYLRAG